MALSQKLFSASRSTLFEFIIIVLGVLVALGVDSWQQEREEFKRLQRYLVALISEIDQNMYSITIIKNIVIPEKLELLENVIVALETSDTDTLSSEEFLGAIIRSTSNAELWFSRNSYDAIINAGGFKRLKERDLEALISNVFTAPRVLLGQAKHLRGDYPKLVS